MDADELLKRYAAGDRDFTQADLSEETLVNARLSGANLIRVNLHQVDFRVTNKGDNPIGERIKGTSKNWFY